ncbi:MAG: RNA polymerase subunit sigma-70 [Comamonadaceae bacterium CG1_02_60_18]|nr:MAG: RNA polymerase subunit sigma-70 [Comamonadaceae bacterium CG1_02_60_18]PIQ56452.1 MAG: RNA polymerase subunit sigma-70 [Comamonadaceae bacterium CG12_big_fil_rev_8_21_14_0_65_59_15]
MNCLTQAWTAHAPELRNWLRHRTHDDALADDLLQDLFLRGLRQGQRFCDLHNARAWLFEVARNLLADHFRVAHASLPLPDDLQAQTEDVATVDELTGCLPRVLSELNADDRDAITLCDLQGVPQAEYARLRGLSLSAAKSRVQRARVRLRQQMSQACQVQIGTEGRVTDFVPRTPHAP